MLDRYGHLIPETPHQAEARKLDRLVFGTGPRVGDAEGGNRVEQPQGLRAAAVAECSQTQQKGLAALTANPLSLRWLRGLDLNQRPLGYEPNELPGCSTPR